mgnify:CR=1 FL=1
MTNHVLNRGEYRRDLFATTGVDAWRRALANEHRYRALEQDLPSKETLPLKEARWNAAFTDALIHAFLGSTSRELPKVWAPSLLHRRAIREQSESRQAINAQ